MPWVTQSIMYKFTKLHLNLITQKSKWPLRSECTKMNKMHRCALSLCGGFPLYLLVFPFVYQFNSRIEALVCSKSVHHLQMTSSEGFQHPLAIISEYVCCGCYMIKNVAFTPVSFAVLKWVVCLSVQVPFE